MKCDTYLQELLAAGNIDECYVGQNVVQSLLADPGDFEAPPVLYQWTSPDSEGNL